MSITYEYIMINIYWFLFVKYYFTTHQKYLAKQEKKARKHLNEAAITIWLMYLEKKMLLEIINWWLGFDKFFFYQVACMRYDHHEDYFKITLIF